MMNVMMVFMTLIMYSVWAQSVEEPVLPGRAAARRRKAVAMTAGLVGALILSRAVDDPALSDELLEAAAATLGRW